MKRSGASRGTSADHGVGHRIRVLLVTDSLAIGGAERMVVDIACGLDRDRFAPHVLVTRSTGELQVALDEAGVPVTVLDRRRRLSIAAYLRASHLTRPSDLIHTHKLGSNVWGALLARTTGVPYVAHEHLWMGGTSSFYALCNRRWVAPVASRVVCVSPSVARILVAQGVPPQRIEVIQNGVLLNEALPRIAARQELGLEPTGFVVGIVARLHPQKNHELVLRALASPALGEGGVTLCIVGDGPLLADLQEEAVRCGVARKVVWAGARHGAHRLVRAFDVSLLCSDWEGLPLAALEAMAAGVPVVGTAVGGLPELLEGGAGVLVPPGDADGIADAIASLRERPDLARDIGNRGQRRVRRDHDFREMLSQLEGTYAEVLQGQHRPDFLPRGRASERRGR